MGDSTNIEWTSATWNPIRGCSRVSAGCMNCYAERQAIRQIKTGYAGLIKRTSHGPAWTGEVRLVPELLDQPLRWKKPRRIFVNSMSDLFHEGVPDDLLDRIFAVMALCPQHTFQILTKRPARMLRYCTSIGEDDTHEPDLDGEAMRDALIEGQAQALYSRLHPREDPSMWLAVHQPLSNVWLGVSVENQETADERIPLLLQTPAAVRFVSYEPALGPVDFVSIKYTHSPGYFGDALQWYHQPHGTTGYPALNWVIVGGESGPGARPCDIAWIRSAVEQCKAAWVPVFCKQMGSVWAKANGADSKGGDPSFWPADLQIREFPHAA